MWFYSTRWQLFQVNFGAATQRKNEELYSRQEQLEKEREILKQSKMEWVNQVGSEIDTNKNV